MFNLLEKAHADIPDPSDLGTVLNPNLSTGDIGGFITFVLTWLIYIAGVVAFIYLIIAGITYITAGGNAEQAKKGQQGLINAIIGIIIVVLSYAILNAVADLGQGATF